MVDNTCPKKQTPASTLAEENIREKRRIFCMVACFPVLIIAVIAAAVAVATAYELIADLRSDLAAALKEQSGTSENEHSIAKNLESQLNHLNIDLVNFSATVVNQVLHLFNNTS